MTRPGGDNPAPRGCRTSDTQGRRSPGACAARGGVTKNVLLGGNLTISNYVNSMDYSIHLVPLTIAIPATIIQ